MVKVDIRIKESAIVRPAEETPKKSLRSSNLDLLVPIVHVPTIYFYKPVNDSSSFFNPQVLKEALSKALVPFYHVAGRLEKDENGRMSILCNAKGVLFVEAETRSTIDELGDFTPHIEMLQFIPDVDRSNIFSYPLLLLQATFFKCGGVCLGVGLHHILGDGTSAIHFINSWSVIARGLSLTTPPFIDRTLLDARVPPIPAMHHVEYDPPPPLNTHHSGDPTLEIQSNPKPTCAKILTITSDQLRTLKNKSRKDVVDGTINYSTFEILAAHIWQCTCKARGITNDQATKLHIPTDGRSRLNPPLPAGYCGNVLFTTAILGLSGEIQSKPLVHTIAKIRGALKRMDNEYLRSAIDYLQVQADLEALKRGPRTFKSPNLNIVSWMAMPIYDADFGWGRPYFMGPAIVGFEGMAYIARCPSNDGSLMIFTCLESNHMELFKEFFYDF
ncbi:PREDICTED: shikimate O-hydroxycinnamoyltransferase-like [Populus euphratica]|uniref:Shikimate O-hydroxycinnamoyltransferase-like n=1 Tax=Populus euphratica TaxID=75702 RepID=A0AAJ6UVJ6_POPEU|nr:PREDICTED: shikimate O-hydroxycinnamoyltransferase-like [Populus euphratica]